eukprot:TRINITY_DN70038_c0_g1_i1.p1 TRINITY_DN70038_c0_g1~~TRINITY_DN70038_c0_g1_i1.p1  ORF type:complete len:604 (+),score=86.47 TRINITY_DN70038_c0_g1_i1:88-1899(+)
MQLLTAAAAAAASAGYAVATVAAAGTTNKPASSPAPSISSAVDASHGFTVHLGLSKLGRLVVSWATPDNAFFASVQSQSSQRGSSRQPRVRYAPRGQDLASVGSIALAATWETWRGQLWANAVLNDLNAMVEYDYQCSGNGGSGVNGVGDDSSLEWGPVLRLRAPPTNNTETAACLLVVGGLSASSAGSEPNHRQPLVVGALRQSVLNRANVVLHLGNMLSKGTPTGVHPTDDVYSRGDRFLSMVHPVASIVPYMTLLGADDGPIDAYRRFFPAHLDAPVVGADAGSGIDHGASDVSGGDPWYSFVVGPARIFMLWTESLLGSNADGDSAAAGLEQTLRQLAWLRSELAQAATPAERSRRPWLVVAGHRPLYCSMSPNVCGPEAARLRNALEELFLMHGVDLYLSSHLHAYERTFPVRNGSLCREPSSVATGADFGISVVPTDGSASACAPVYIVNGDAGQPLLRYTSAPALWSSQRHPGVVSGFGEIIFHNATHLQYQQLAAASLDGVESVTDEFWVVKTFEATSEMQEENFLEAVGWLAFATGSITGTLAFLRWVHSDGLQRRDQAYNHLRVELAVLTGLPIKSDVEVEALLRSTSDPALR